MAFFSIFSSGKAFGYLALGIVCFLLAYVFIKTEIVPSSFPVGATFTVNENEPLRTISKRLKEQHIIGSSLLFRTWVSYLNKDRHVQLGIYEFPKALSLGSVVQQLVVAGPDHPLLQITIPEGSTDEEVITAITSALKTASREKLLAFISENKATGKLFPSTYFVLPSMEEKTILGTMLATFESTYEEHFQKALIPPTLQTRDKVIILASILEAEANNPEDMAIVSGILQKRLTLGIALQVDAAKETYKKKGLPEAAVNNPGLTALDAALHPKISSYLYYITGKNGTMYYAKTFEEHKQNISKYLR